ncbi:hypothetical protein [Pseudomonas indica]|uniref:hypothetical protein n=1 Tax=Pseudomonas indica TaxID=137658 RepID=UPI003FD4FE6D
MTKVEQIPLDMCVPCCGQGVINGVFHRMVCAGCGGVGFVRKNGSVIEGEEAVLQLRLRLNRALSMLRVYEQARPAGPSGDYQGIENKHHAGGGNYTGD